MDIEGLEQLLRDIEQGQVKCVARDLPEPSPWRRDSQRAPYAFLDDAPLEERRTQAVYTRRALSPGNDNGLGILDAAAIEQVIREAWPDPKFDDELHEALLLLGSHDRRGNAAGPSELCNGSKEPIQHLIESNRATRLVLEPNNGCLAFLDCGQRWPMLQSIHPEGRIDPPLNTSGISYAPAMGTI